VRKEKLRAWFPLAARNNFNVSHVYYTIGTNKFLPMLCFGLYYDSQGPSGSQNGPNRCAFSEI
jgi:hypothetical protein